MPLSNLGTEDCSLGTSPEAPPVRGEKRLPSCPLAVSSAPSGPCSEVGEVEKGSVYSEVTWGGPLETAREDVV